MRLKKILSTGLGLLLFPGMLLAQDPGVGGPVSKNILYGGTATLWPDFQDGTGVIDNGVGAVVSGSPYVVSPLFSTTYTLKITNLAGDFVTQVTNVNVAPVVVSAVSPATKAVSVGHMATFTASVGGAVDASLIWSVDGQPGGTAGTGTITSGGVYTAPASAGTHTITATSNANQSVSQSAVVNVVPLPSIDVALAASPASINYGGTAVLTASYSNGSAVITGGVTNAPIGASPANFTTPALATTTVYTITVTNEAGETVTGQATVTVSSVTVSALAPASKYVSLSKGFQPTGGAVSGAVDTTVSWLVNGVVGGNSTYGTIDAAGNYTAPASMPGNPSVVIRCVANAEPGAFQEMTVNLVKLPTIQSFTVN